MYGKRTGDPEACAGASTLPPNPRRSIGTSRGVGRARDAAREETSPRPLAVLAAHSKMSLTRDTAVDLLWPDADGDSAVNSLNQTVFQLRRHLDPDYEQGDSPEYVINSAEQLKLADDLIRTDIDEIRSLPRRIAGVPWARRQEIASRRHCPRAGRVPRRPPIRDLDLRAPSASATAYIRASLLPIAVGQALLSTSRSRSTRRPALVTLDPFDEAATQALAENLARSGRRRALRKTFSSSTRELMDDDQMSQRHRDR